MPTPGYSGSGRDRTGTRPESFQALSTGSIPVARFHSYRLRLTTTPPLIVRANAHGAGNAEDELVAGQVGEDLLAVTPGW
jgi:hypothetical protein